jgi:SAM-dependent methyltransferase
MSDALLNIMMSKEELGEFEDVMRKVRHIERYRFIRRFCIGKVIDIGCGVGYGSYMIAQNPEVSQVIGVEPNNASWMYAREEFKDPKITYYNQSYEAREGFDADVAVIVEVLEHVPEPEAIIKDCAAVGVRRIIATVPSYRTKHFNPHHLHDFTAAKFNALFVKYGYEELFMNHFRDEVFLGVFQLPENPEDGKKD